MATSSYTEELGDYLVEINLNKLLGKGSYGQVFLGKHVRTGRKVAAKLLQAEKIYVTEDTDFEARAMMAIPPHENVLKIYDLIKKEVIEHKALINFWLIIEFCPLGNLVDYAVQNSVSLIDKVDLMLQGNHGLLHLHNIKPKAYVHRDLKPSNMLIAGGSDKVVLKLGDFGEVRIIEQSQMMSSVRGTKSYWAPEMFSLSESNTKPSYEKSVDLFSKGLSDLALLDCGDKQRMTAKTEDGKQLGLYLYQNRRRAVTVHIDKESDSEDVKKVKQLLGLMISQNASDRPSIKEVVDALNYLLINLRANSVKDNTPTLIAKLTPSRGETTSGATAQPPPGSASGHRAGASSNLTKPHRAASRIHNPRELTPSRGEAASGGTAQPSPGSASGHGAGTSSNLTKPHQAAPRRADLDPRELVPSRGECSAPGTTAQSPPGSEHGHLAGASSDVDQAEQLPIHEVNDRLAGLDVRPATRDVLLAMGTYEWLGYKRGLWILAGDEWQEQTIPQEIPKWEVCFYTTPKGLVAMGGTDDYSTNSAKCFFFSLDTKQWTELPDMITPRSYASAVEIRENVVMVVGGWDNEGNDSAVCEILDIGRGEWVPVVSMAEPLLRPRVAALGDRAYVLPRYAEEDQVTEKYIRMLQVQEINTVENTSTQKAPLAHSKDSEPLGLVGLVGKLYFFSVDDAGSDRGQCSRYDPVTDQWSVMEARYPLSYRYPWHSAAVVMDEKILLCGGDEDRTAMVEYNTTTNQGRILRTRLPFIFDWQCSYVGVAHVRV